MPTLAISSQASDGSPQVGTNFTVTAVGEFKYQGSIPDTTSSAGQLVKATFAHADVAAVFLSSTQNLTINTNSDGSPVQSISLTANVPVIVNPFTSDVTALYLRNASLTTAATVTIIVLLNSSAS